MKILLRECSIWSSLGALLLLFRRPQPTIGFVWAARNSSRASATLRMSQSVSTTDKQDGTSASPKILRVLALHGSEGDAEEFPKRLAALTQAFENDPVALLDITAVQAPFAKGSGFSWWMMPPGVRSFNAKEYEGFEESASKVLDIWKSNEFDIVFGHSQGAILIASLIALGRIPYHPPSGYIFNGVSFPNPFAREITSLTLTDNAASDPPRVLFVLGRNDKITPNSSGEQLRDGLASAGFMVSSCYHDGGHGIPGQDDSTSVINMKRWILDDGMT